MGLSVEKERRDMQGRMKKEGIGQAEQFSLVM